MLANPDRVTALSGQMMDSISCKMADLRLFKGRRRMRDSCRMRTGTTRFLPKFCELVE